MADKFETFEYDIGGVQTVVKAIGTGRPVVFLHGAATLEGFDFAAALADRFRVYCPSHPGMGYSGDAPHVSGMADLIVHYLNLLDEMNLPEKPHLVGFSMGGWMAAELAAVARQEFDRVVLIAPAGLNDPDHPATDLGAVAPQDLPGYLTHDAAVALRFFPTARTRMLRRNLAQIAPAKPRRWPGCARPLAWAIPICAACSPGSAIRPLSSGGTRTGCCPPVNCLSGPPLCQTGRPFWSKAPVTWFCRNIPKH